MAAAHLAAVVPLRFERAGGTLAAAPSLPPAAAPSAADSWLVRDGRVRALERHLVRFATAATEAATEHGEHPPARPELEAFADAVRRAMPARGRWFPRVEWRPGGLLVLLLRPAPAAADPPAVTVAVSAAGDPRTHPHRKGPDLGRLGAVRAAAVRSGADEALLAEGDGRLLEGAYSSLLWWEDGRLWAVPTAQGAFAGVTRGLLLERAADEGVLGGERRPSPAELDGRELWVTSALHGIRPVTAVSGRRWRAGPPERAQGWQRWLDGLAAPVRLRD